MQVHEIPLMFVVVLLVKACDFVDVLLCPNTSRARVSAESYALYSHYIVMTVSLNNASFTSRFGNCLSLFQCNITHLYVSRV